MPKVSVLVEISRSQPKAFEFHAAALVSVVESEKQAESLVQDLAGYGLDVLPDFAPVPMFPQKAVFAERAGFAAFASPETNPDLSSETSVVACEVDSSRLSKFRERTDVRVWPNSELTLLDEFDEEQVLFDLADSGGGVDCRPFQPAVPILTIRRLLGVRRVWRDGFRGQNVVVGIIDEGVDGTAYPVVGGFSRPNAPRPGTAAITSHGSMCAADVLVAAPAAKLYDYPFLGIPNSGGALTMFQAALDQRRRDGTPHLTTNSYGFVGVPPQETNPNHEIWDINHPLHRKVREVVASGAPALFAAGNCGANCPSRVCHPSGIGPSKSIHASNSLAEVITVAAVNSRHERIGYSSQGPGMFEPAKPDVSAYSHFFGNFGPGRPGGETDQPFDNGTSAATPVAAGVVALLLSVFPNLIPAEVKEALIAGAIDIGQPGRDDNTGYGVVNAAASYLSLRTRLLTGALHPAAPAAARAGGRTGRTV